MTEQLQKTEFGFERHIIKIQSAYRIESGVLGYSFVSDGYVFTSAFPGAIERGKRKYSSFFTKADANVQVKVVNGENADISIEEKKNRFIFF